MLNNVTAFLDAAEMNPKKDIMDGKLKIEETKEV